MREFSPPVRRAALRVTLAVVFPLIVVVPLGWLFATAFGLSSIRYTVGDGALVVHSGDMVAGERSLPLADISEARVVKARGGRRTAGTALPGHCAGRFSYPEFGAVWQATHCGADAVLVSAKGAVSPVLLTPPDPEGFVAALHAGTPTSITLPAPDASPLRAVAVLVGGAGVVTVLMVSVLLLLGPARMRYRVGDGVLEVRTLFGRQSWPTAGAHAQAHTPVQPWRIAGAGVPGCYYTGRYRESGQDTRVYATELDRVVLFEGADRVLVSPEDRVAFLRALGEEGAIVKHHA